MTPWRNRACIVAAAAVLAGCTMSAVQTSSGSDYLARSPAIGLPPATAGEATTNLNEAVRRAADVEPTLQFPTKICLARIERFGLTEPPPDELAQWEQLSEKLGPSVGEFAVLNPLVASLAATTYTHPDNEAPLARMVADIRLGAAREHCDTAFIYEPRATGKTSNTPLQLLDLTIVGYFIVPSTGVQADGTVQALLVDVRSGYPYAQLTGQSHNETFTTGNTRGNAMVNNADHARLSAVADLIKKIPDTLSTLRTRLSDRKMSEK